MFKVCPKCGTGWENRQSFLTDPSLQMIGYQANFEALTLGLFLFNHTCVTTLSIHVDVFTDLYDGPVFTERELGSEKCPGYCLSKVNLDDCPVMCECAYIRKVMQVIKNKKAG